VEEPPLRRLLPPPPLLPTDATLGGTPTSLAALLPQSLLLPMSVLLRRLLLRRLLLPPGVTGWQRADSAPDMAQLPRLLLLLRGEALLPAASPDALLPLLPGGGGVTPTGARPRGSQV
jgi:hypothetical protein